MVKPPYFCSISPARRCGVELPELPKLKFCVFCLPSATSSATEFAGTLLAAASSSGDHETLMTGSIAFERSK